MSRLALFVLGPPRLELNGQPVVIDRNKAMALLVYLAVDGGTHTRQTLGTLLWPEYDQSRALAYLRRTLWTLNDALGEGWLEITGEMICWKHAADFTLDLEQFKERSKACQAPGEAEGCQECLSLLLEATELYRGDFLAGFSLRDSPEFDNWQFFQAEGLRQELGRILEKLAGCYHLLGEYEGAMNAARRWLVLDPLEEAAHRQLILAYLASGQRSGALRQYQETLRLLQEELGVEPAAETKALLEQIKSWPRGKAGLIPTPVAPQALHTSYPVDSPSNAAPLYNLPPQPTPFVGRLEELAQITALIRNPACRLLTLLGPGGIGKTRLAIEAAREHASSDGNAAGLQGEERRTTTFRQGIYFVPLAPLVSAELLVPTLAEVLRISLRAEDAPLPQVLNYLREKQVLLVLDNFEHLMAGAELLSTLLASAAGVKVIVTSRERLNLREEWVFEVPGMSFPVQEDEQAWESFSAVKLFLQNARHARADFQITSAERADIVRICRLVEGVPLGIELAAAWVKMFSCHEIAQEIERNRDFLATSLRGVPERHQSLRAVFEHSWNLLTPAERAAYRKLSVFRGDFRREAAEAVIGTLAVEDCNPAPGMAALAAASAASLVACTPLALLSALVDKSMLRRSVSGSAGRYEMHELLKQYAAEKLVQASDEFEQARQRHAEFFITFLSQVWDDLRGAAQIEALRRVEEEIEDVRLAWSWAIEQGKVGELGQSAPVLALFYTIRSRSQEGEELFRQGVDRLRFIRQAAYATGQADSLLDWVYAYLLRELASFTGSLGNYEAYTQLSKESLAIARQLEAEGRAERRIDPYQQAFLYMRLNFGDYFTEPDEVMRLYLESLEIFAQAGDRWSIAMSYLAMGGFAEYSYKDMVLSRHLREKGLAIFEALKNPWGKVFSLNELASLLVELGEYAEAERLSQESLPVCKTLSDRWRTVTCLLNLGMVTTALGDYERAKSYYQESVALVREAGNLSLIGVHLDSLGYVEYLLGEFQEAEKVFQESLALNQENRDQRGMGMALLNLGDIARAEEQLDLARERYQQGLNLLQITEMTWGIAMGLKKLAGVSIQTSELPAARRYLHQALEQALSIERFPEVEDIFIGLAELLSAEGMVEKAVELLAHIAAHHATAREAKERALQLLERLSAKAQAGEFAAAQQRGRHASLDLMAAELLQILAEDTENSS